VGPEGGLTSQEESRFARRFSLGPTILRIETAAVVAAARLLS
jgi:RsmE family RNA methyltransferase